MLQFVDSFDNWGTLAAATLGKWTSFVGGALSIDTVNSRTGAQDLMVTLAAANTDSYLDKLLAKPGARFTAGVAVMVSALPANPIGLMQWTDQNTPQVTLVLNPDGTVSVNSGTASGAQLLVTGNPVITMPGIYYTVEMMAVFDTAVGFLSLQVNGLAVGLAGGLNTAPSGNARADRVRLGYFAAGIVTVNLNYDDFYVNNDTPPYNTGFEATPTETFRVYEFFPTANGVTDDFLPTPQPSQNWQCVSAISALDDTIFVADNTTGDLDLYKHDALPSTVTAVLGVQQSSIARKEVAIGSTTEAAFVAVSNVVRSGEVEADADGVNTTDAYAWYLNILESDPNTQVPFTAQACNDAEIGVKAALIE